MKSPTGSLRLDSILAMLPQSQSVADVGCDHGKLSIALIEEGLAKKVWAMDLRQGPLSKATQAIQKANLQDRVVPLLSDGLVMLPEDVDTIVIAGMGGETIAHILTSEEGNTQERLAKAKSLILSPQSEWRELRSLLFEQHFAIEKEDMVVENDKYYLILSVVHAEQGQQEPKKLDLDMYPFGTYLSQTHNQCFLDYIKKEIQKEKRLIEELEVKSNLKTKALLDALNEHQEILKALLIEEDRCR